MRILRGLLLAALTALSLSTFGSVAAAGPGGGMGGGDGMGGGMGAGDGMGGGRRGCHRDYRPVCGVDRRTYPNACVARSNGVRVAYAGRCRVVACPRIYRPVCGVNHRTYPNACVARSNGVPIR